MRKRGGENSPTTWWPPPCHDAGRRLLPGARKLITDLGEKSAEKRICFLCKLPILCYWCSSRQWLKAQWENENTYHTFPYLSFNNAHSTTPEESLWVSSETHFPITDRASSPSSLSSQGNAPWVPSAPYSSRVYGLYIRWVLGLKQFD